MDLPVGTFRAALATTDAAGTTLWLSLSDLGDVLVMAGVLQEPELLVVDAFPSGELSIRSADGLRVLRVAPHTRKLFGAAVAAARDAACYFTAQRVAPSSMLFSLLANDGAPVARTESGDELVATMSVLHSARPACAFRLALEPLLGSLTPSATLRLRADARVAVWSVGARAWLTVHHPPAMFRLDGGKVTATATKLDGWEVLNVSVVSAEEESIALRGVHGKWLCAETTGVLVADRPAVSGWETFKMVPAPAVGNPAVVALRTAHGKFVSAASHDRVTCGASAVGPDETFIVVDVAVGERLFWLGTPRPTGTLPPPMSPPPPTHSEATVAKVAAIVSVEMPPARGPRAAAAAAAAASPDPVAGVADI